MLSVQLWFHILRYCVPHLVLGYSAKVLEYGSWGGALEQVHNHNPYCIDGVWVLGGGPRAGVHWEYGSWEGPSSRCAHGGGRPECWVPGVGECNVVWFDCGTIWV